MKIKTLWVCIFMLMGTIVFQRYENHSLNNQLRETTESYESLGEEFRESSIINQLAIEYLKEKNRGCK